MKKTKTSQHSKKSYEQSVGPVDEGMYKDPFFGDNPCGRSSVDVPSIEDFSK